MFKKIKSILKEYRKLIFIQIAILIALTLAFYFYIAFEPKSTFFYVD